MTRNPTLAFGAWLATAPRDWPDAAVRAARDAFLDGIAVTVPGAADPAARTIFETVRGWGSGPAAAIGFGTGLAAPWAALVNGTAAHALDFDDNFDPPKAHATAVLVPAILALGEQEGAPGADCIDAYIAGLQIMGRTGQGVNPPHRNRGWHATATLGAIGAAAACARLLRLPTQMAAHALSLATSMAGGFMSQFGTQAKPLHAGLAAKAGVIAASLARDGLTAGLGTFDGPTGMNRLMVGPDYEQLRDGLTRIEHGQNLRFETESVGDPLLILSSGLKVKRFPNCGSAHRAMDGLLALREAHGFAAEEVAEVNVRYPAVHNANLMYGDPRDAAQAKFSLEYALAVLLLQGNCTLADFAGDAPLRPEVRALYPRIRRHPVDRSEGEYPTRVEVVLAGGRRLETAVRMPAGSIDAPFTPEQYRAKFAGCVAGLLSPAEADALYRAIGALPRLRDIGELTAALRIPFALEREDSQ
ncbi:MmgE/PrpD family protein [Sphingomonas canadensis]|uniref:MmgE/PrpD family protein n=1 Tax=Sphingomonas canadensis TaxID=1219257 RepID=A0ABW3HE09_9SPHN|nr:MmgE/PrpD family protein [Sphingomonas canadensis]MCW3838418.1 MmgE/PrpD family protein [Sphingomonas canadensis]